MLAGRRRTACRSDNVRQPAGRIFAAVAGVFAAGRIAAAAEVAAVFDGPILQLVCQASAAL